MLQRKGALLNLTQSLKEVLFLNALHSFTWVDWDWLRGHSSKELSKGNL